MTSERFVGRRAKQSRPVLLWGGGGWLHPPGTHPSSLTAHHRFSALPPLSGLQRYLQHPEVQKAVGCPWKGSELAESGGCQVVSACPCVAESSGLWTLLRCNALTWLHSLLLVPQVLGQSWLFVPQPQQPQHCSVHAQHCVHPWALCPPLGNVSTPGHRLLGCCFSSHLPLHTFSPSPSPASWAEPDPPFLLLAARSGPLQLNWPLSPLTHSVTPGGGSNAVPGELLLPKSRVTAPACPVGCRDATS